MSTLALIPHCYVYKVPPRARAEGHKASDWDLTQHLWEGQVVVAAAGDHCIVRLQKEDGSVFAECKFDNSTSASASQSVEKVRAASLSGPRIQQEPTFFFFFPLPFSLFLGHRLLEILCTADRAQRQVCVHRAGIQ